MTEIIHNPLKFLNKTFNYALVGASSSWQDHAYYLLLKMEKAGYKVTPLHFEETQICGVHAFPSLRYIPNLDIVIFASKDENESIKYLREMRDNGFYKAWFEPNYHTQQMESFARDHFFEVVKNEGLLEGLQNGKFS